MKLRNFFKTLVAAPFIYTELILIIAAAAQPISYPVIVNSVASNRKLKCSWSVECDRNLQEIYNIKSEKALADAIGESIKNCI